MSLYDERTAASARGDIKFMPSKPCKRGHVSERYVSTGACVECLHRFYTPIGGAKNSGAPIRGLWNFILPVPVGFTKEHALAMQKPLEAYVNEILAAWRAQHGEAEKRT